jgi:hypothetical protein
MDFPQAGLASQVILTPFITSTPFSPAFLLPVSSRSACGKSRPVPELRFLSSFHVFASWLGRPNILNVLFPLRFAAMQ